MGVASSRRHYACSPPKAYFVEFYGRMEGFWSFGESYMHLLSKSAQTYKEGIESNKTKEKLRSYCLGNLYTVLKGL